MPIAGGRHIIVFFHTGHPNHTGILKYVRPALELSGYSCVEIAFSDPSALADLSTLLIEHADEIFCFYSVNFYIKELAFRNFWMASQNKSDDRTSGELYLHQLINIPLVLHLYDHPLYLLKHESAAFDRSIVFVNGVDMIDFMQKHFRGTYTYVPIPKDAEIPVLTGSSDAPSRADFFARRNEIFAPMNLSVQNLTVDGHWARIKELPRARRNRAERLVEAALYDCATPLHMISERLAAGGDPEIEIHDQLHVLNFIKLWRRTKIVRALIDLPVLISSDFVPADLSRNHPGNFTRTSMAETLMLYKHFRFTLNCFPLVTDALHDRIYNPLFANSLLVSDRNRLATEVFEDGLDLLFLDYEAADMGAKVRPYLDNPELAYQLTVTSYQRRTASARPDGKALPDGLCGTLIDTVKAQWRARGGPTLLGMLVGRRVPDEAECV